MIKQSSESGKDQKGETDRGAADLEGGISRRWNITALELSRCDQQRDTA